MTEKDAEDFLVKIFLKQQSDIELQPSGCSITNTVYILIIMSPQ